MTVQTFLLCLPRVACLIFCLLLNIRVKNLSRFTTDIPSLGTDKPTFQENPQALPNEDSWSPWYMSSMRAKRDSALFIPVSLAPTGSISICSILKTAPFTEQLLHVRHCSKHPTHINSFNLHNNTMKQMKAKTMAQGHTVRAGVRM